MAIGISVLCSLFSYNWLWIRFLCNTKWPDCLFVFLMEQRWDPKCDRMNGSQIPSSTLGDINKPVTYRNPLSVKWTEGGKVKAVNIYWASNSCQAVSLCSLISFNSTGFWECRNNFSSFTTSQQLERFSNLTRVSDWCLNGHLSPHNRKELFLEFL